MFARNHAALFLCIINVFLLIKTETNISIHNQIIKKCMALLHVAHAATHIHHSRKLEYTQLQWLNVYPLVSVSAQVQQVSLGH
jgi:hypothetical protein